MSYEKIVYLYVYVSTFSTQRIGVNLDKVCAYYMKKWENSDGSRLVVVLDGGELDIDMSFDEFDNIYKTYLHSII